MKLNEVKNQLMASESAVEAATKALEEAKAKLEAAQKEANAKREQVAAVEKARAELDQKLMRGMVLFNRQPKPSRRWSSRLQTFNRSYLN